MSKGTPHAGPEFRTLLERESERAGLELPSLTLDRISGHYRLLAKWNRAVRLVGSVDPITVIRRHILESLQLAAFVHEPRGAMLDIGSGNGFPALPVKCLYPDLRLGMVESTRRKATFLNTVVAELELADTEVIVTRIRRTRDLERLGRWDCISMRAVSAIPVLMEAASSVLRPSGRILCLVGQAGREEILSRTGADLEVVADRVLPGTRASFILAVGRADAAGSGRTIH